jgi:hypothetical protein
MKTTRTSDKSRLDAILRRVKNRSFYDLALPALALAGLAMAIVSITGA